MKTPQSQQKEYQISILLGDLKPEEIFCGASYLGFLFLRRR